jgi:hypothetical protein
LRKRRRPPRRRRRRSFKCTPHSSPPLISISISKKKHDEDQIFLKKFFKIQGR